MKQFARQRIQDHIDPSAICFSLDIRQERVVSGIEYVMACYSKRPHKVLSLVIVPYSCEDLGRLLSFITMLEMTNLSAYHFAYLDSCQADTTASRLDEYSLITTVSLK